MTEYRDICDSVEPPYDNGQRAGSKQSTIVLASTIVRIYEGCSDKSEEEVGLNQGSVLSPCLYFVAMGVFSECVTRE